MNDRRPIRAEVTETLRLAGPIVAAQFCLMGMTFAANIIVGRLGELPLAALSIGGALYAIPLYAAIGTLSALSPLISESFGAARHGDVGRLWRQGVLIALVISIPSVIALCFATPILAAMGQSPEVAHAARLYIAGLSLALPAQFLFIAHRNMTEGTSDSKPTMLLAVLGLSLAIVVVQWMALDGPGRLGLGVYGAGLGLAIANTAMSLALLGYVLLRPRYRPFALTRRPWIEWPLAARVARLGVPLAGGILGEMLFFAGSTMVVGTMGQRAVASHQIALNAASMTYMASLGLSIAVAVRVGQRRGAEDPAGATRAGWIGFGLIVAIASVFTLLFVLFPDRIASLYTTDPELNAAARVLLRWAGIFQVADGLQTVGIGALRGMRDVRAPFRNTLVAYWLIGTPVGLVCAFTMKMGPSGIWIGLLTGLTVATLMHWRRYHRLTSALRTR